MGYLHYFTSGLIVLLDIQCSTCENHGSLDTSGSGCYNFTDSCLLPLHQHLFTPLCTPVIQTPSHINTDCLIVLVLIVLSSFVLQVFWLWGCACCTFPFLLSSPFIMCSLYHILINNHCINTYSVMISWTYFSFLFTCLLHFVYLLHYVWFVIWTFSLIIPIQSYFLLYVSLVLYQGYARLCCAKHCCTYYFLFFQLWRCAAFIT